MVVAHYGDYNNIIHEIIGSLRYDLVKNTNLQAEYIIYKEKPEKDNNKFIFQTEVTF